MWRPHLLIFFLLVGRSVTQEEDESTEDKTTKIPEESEEEVEELFDIYNETYYRCDYTYIESAQGWFKIHYRPLNFTTALYHCLTEGALLTSPFDEDQLQAMLQMMNDSEPQIGARGLLTGFTRDLNGYFVSIDGYTLDESENLDWDNFQPDNINGSEHCIYLRPIKDGYPNGSIADESCLRLAPFMCYKEFDDIERNECGTTVGYETYFMPNITKKYDPCYKYVIDDKLHLTWAEANIVCMIDGGHLAHHITRCMNSTDYYVPGENPFFFNRYNDYYRRYDLWVGFTSNYYTPNDGDDWIAYPSEKTRFEVIEEEYREKMYEGLNADTYNQKYEDRYFCAVSVGDTYSGVKFEKCDEKRGYICERPKTAFTNCRLYEKREKKFLKDIKAVKETPPQYRCDYEYLEDGYGWFKLHTIPLNFTNARLMCKYEGKSNIGCKKT